MAMFLLKPLLAAIFLFSGIVSSLPSGNPTTSTGEDPGLLGSVVDTLNSTLTSRAQGVLHFIAVRGSTEGTPAGIPPGVGYMMHAVGQKIHKAHPNTQTTAVQYPAVNYYEVGAAAYEQSVQTGAKNLITMITNIVEADSNAHIALGGYSQGAEVIFEALCDGDDVPAADRYNINSIVVFGDPTHDPQQQYVVGNPVGTTAGVSAVYSRGNPICKPFSTRILSTCQGGDPVCDAGNQNPDYNVHLSYTGNDAYTTHAANYVVSRFDCAAGAC